MRFADRVQKHFFNDGVLSEQRSAEFYNLRAEEVRPSLVAESARWGDRQRRDEPYTTRNEWQSMLNFMNQRFFPRRNRTVLRQLRATRVFPGTVAPVFSQHGGRVGEGFLLGMSAVSGEVYFTADGGDPRLVGGDVSPVAAVYDGGGLGVAIESATTVRARVLDEGEWSALTEATFITDEAAGGQNLVISEIYYNPAGVEEDGEFIELQNIGGCGDQSCGCAVRRGDRLPVSGFCDARPGGASGVDSGGLRRAAGQRWRGPFADGQRRLGDPAIPLRRPGAVADGCRRRWAVVGSGQPLGEPGPQSCGELAAEFGGGWSSGGERFEGSRLRALICGFSFWGVGFRRSQSRTGWRG